MDTTPLAKDLWEGIGGHFDSIGQVLCEFIDNSVSNFQKSSSPVKTVTITIEELGEDKVRVLVEDTGFGIAKLENALRIGDRTLRETPLNEHGFGLKHALATSNPENDSWKIYTRTRTDFQNNKYKVVCAPYDFDMPCEVVNENDTSWPGIHNNSGTIVEFESTKVFFNTIQRGISGLASFERCLDYLKEDLGYVYAGMIEKGKLNINLKSVGYNTTVEAVQPKWLGYYNPKPGKIKIDLGGGSLNINYQFGEMGESEHVKHYKRNMSTSGVEIRVNGRLLMSNIFKQIWEMENHPSYNHFLVIINLETNNPSTLPKTRTSKNGIRDGDEKLEALYSWIRKTHPTPHKELSDAVSEKELVNELKDLKEKQIRNKSKCIETEFKVFRKIGSPVPMDLYAFDGQDLVLYEAKKDTADVQNLYQLLMYWDGAIADGLPPTEGILIAKDFSSGVDTVLKILNSRKDNNGNQYNFSTKTWKDEGIKYPRP